MTISTTLYPHLSAIRESLEAALTPIPVLVHADRSAVLAQVTPAVHLLPGKALVVDSLKAGRTLSSVSLASEWEVLCLARNASDQRDMVTALTELGELLAQVLIAIAQGLTRSGGTLTLLDVPAAKTWAGGLVSGSILFRLGWVFNASA